VRITPEDFARDLPDIQVIWDATGFKMKSKENVLLSRVLYSAYHHTSEGFAVFGKCDDVFVTFCTGILHVNVPC
jgi:hypothetical protein